MKRHHGSGKGTLVQNVCGWSATDGERRARANAMFRSPPRHERVLDRSPRLSERGVHDRQICGSVSQIISSRCVPSRVLEGDLLLLVLILCWDEHAENKCIPRGQLFSLGAFACVLFSLLVVWIGLVQALLRKPVFEFPVDLVCFSCWYLYLVI